MEQLRNGAGGVLFLHDGVNRWKAPEAPRVADFVCKALTGLCERP
jgi:hypothetical protein